MCCCQGNMPFRPKSRVISTEVEKFHRLRGSDVSASRLFKLRYRKASRLSAVRLAVDMTVICGRDVSAGACPERSQRGRRDREPPRPRSASTPPREGNSPYPGSPFPSTEGWTRNADGVVHARRFNAAHNANGTNAIAAAAPLPPQPSPSRLLPPPLSLLNCA